MKKIKNQLIFFIMMLLNLHQNLIEFLKITSKLIKNFISQKN
jgi:hypothetical protein